MNITIADTADVASWDVQVMLTGGKKGIGTEIFAITVKNPLDNATGVPPSGARWVFGTLGTSIDLSGNVTLHTAGVYGDGRDRIGSMTLPTFGFIYLWKVMQIPVGSSRQQATHIRIDQPNCTRLMIGTQTSDGDLTTTSGGVRITRVAGAAPATHFLSQLPGYVAGEWLVETIDVWTSAARPPVPLFSVEDAQTNGLATTASPLAHRVR